MRELQVGFGSWIWKSQSIQSHHVISQILSPRRSESRIEASVLTLLDLRESRLKVMIRGNGDKYEKLQSYGHLPYKLPIQRYANAPIQPNVHRSNRIVIPVNRRIPHGQRNLIHTRVINRLPPKLGPPRISRSKNRPIVHPKVLTIRDAPP